MIRRSVALLLASGHPNNIDSYDQSNMIYVEQWTRNKGN